MRGSTDPANGTSPEWGSRLEQSNVTDDVLRYFGRPLILLDQPDFDYDGAYYYMHEPGAPIGLGFCLRQRGGNARRRAVSGLLSAFTARAKSSTTTAYMISLPEQAALLYQNTLLQGCAVIRALGLNSRDGFRLESLRIE